MSDIQVAVRELRPDRRKDAREQVRKKWARGEVPQLEELARARGLVVRERENSIFSDAWIPLAIVYCLVGLLAANRPAFLGLGSALLIIVGVSAWWKNHALDGVYYRRRFDRTRVFPGETIEMTLTVLNNKRLPLTWLRFSDDLPVMADINSLYAEVAAELGGRFTHSNTFSIGGYEMAERAVSLRFPRRGHYRIGPVSYKSGDVFTLFTIEREHDYRQRLVVYPQIWPLEALGLPAKEPFGDVRIHQSLFTDPNRMRGIRDYQPQDRFRDVHWKATARRSTLQTKIYDPSIGMTAAVFLNVTTQPRHWMGFDPDLLERAVSVAASVANYGIEQGWAVGLYANGAVPGSDQPIRVRPGRSPEQLGHLLEALAAVTEFATGSIDRLMNRESNRLPWGATIVLVTAIVTDEMAVSLIRLKEAGRRVALLSLAEDPPPDLRGIITYHIPAADRHPSSFILHSFP